MLLILQPVPSKKLKLFCHKKPASYRTFPASFRHCSGFLFNISVLLPAGLASLPYYSKSRLKAGPYLCIMPRLSTI